MSEFTDTVFYDVTLTSAALLHTTLALASVSSEFNPAWPIDETRIAWARCKPPPTLYAGNNVIQVFPGSRRVLIGTLMQTLCFHSSRDKPKMSCLCVLCLVTEDDLVKGSIPQLVA